MQYATSSIKILIVNEITFKESFQDIILYKYRNKILAHWSSG